MEEHAGCLHRPFLYRVCLRYRVLVSMEDSRDCSEGTDNLRHAVIVMQLAEAEKERLRLEEHQVVIADLVRGEVCEEWRSVIGQMADEHEVRIRELLRSRVQACQS